MNLSVRARITLWNVAVVALALIGAGVGLRYLVAAQLARVVDDQLDSHTFRMTVVLTDPRIPLPYEPSRVIDLFRISKSPDDPGFTGGKEQPGAQIPPFVFRIVHPGRDPAAAGVFGTPLDPRTLARTLDGAVVFSDLTIEGEPYRVISRPVRRGNRVVGALQAGLSLAASESVLAGLSRVLLLLLPLALLLAAAGGAFLTERALRPVREITEAAGHIEATDLSERLPAHGRDEFSRLALMLNGMLERLQAAFERQKQFTADASHELRTPLATVMAVSSLAVEDEWDAGQCHAGMRRVRHAARRAQRIVEDLLLLARSDSGQLPFVRSPVSLREVIDTAVTEAVSAARGNDGGVTAPAPITLQLPPGSALWVEGDESHLVRLLVNLLDNALRHTPPGGSIEVVALESESVEGGAAVERAGTREAGGWSVERGDRPDSDRSTLYAPRSTVSITVSDRGEGIAAEHLPHLGERFYRADVARDRNRGGSGLGLAICKSIVEAHGGSLAIDSVLGEGTCVTVTLPGAATDPDP